MKVMISLTKMVMIKKRNYKKFLTEKLHNLRIQPVKLAKYKICVI